MQNTKAAILEIEAFISKVELFTHTGKAQQALKGFYKIEYCAHNRATE